MALNRLTNLCGLLLVTCVAQAPAPAEPARSPLAVELRLQQRANEHGRRLVSSRVEAVEAFLLLEAPLRDGDVASDLAGSLFEILPDSVNRLWLSWPGATAGDARLFWRGAPVAQQVESLLARDESVSAQRLHPDPCKPTHLVSGNASQATGRRCPR